MFDIGFWELTVIAIVALIVIGPDKLPGLARTAGLWIGKARHFLGNVKADIDRELKADELRRALDNNADINELKDILSSTRDTIEQEANPDYLVKAMSDDRPEPIDSAASSDESGAAEEAPSEAEPVKTENQRRAEERTRRLYENEAEAKRAARESLGTEAEASAGQGAGEAAPAATQTELDKSEAGESAEADNNKKQ
ncbi:MAG TPA: Sec-independent protein translocase protein TatB [Gammaproteobacteria bacterium]|nr:Sec-independent protein translocase protein TatB [Gammaproteobacteria bacterium]